MPVGEINPMETPAHAQAKTKNSVFYFISITIYLENAILF